MVGIWVPGGKVPLCRGIYHYDCSFWCRLLQVHKTSSDSVYYQKFFLSENDHVLASSLAFQVRKTCLHNRRNQKQHLKVGKVHVVYQSLVDERESRHNTQQQQSNLNWSSPEGNLPREEDSQLPATPDPRIQLLPPTSELRVHLPLLPPHDPLLSLVEPARHSLWTRRAAFHTRWLVRRVGVGGIQCGFRGFERWSF